MHDNEVYGQSTFLYFHGTKVIAKVKAQGFWVRGRLQIRPLQASREEMLGLVTVSRDTDTWSLEMCG